MAWGFWQVLAVRAFSLDQVRNRGQPEAIDAHIQPELMTLHIFFSDFGFFELRSGWC